MNEPYPVTFAQTPNGELIKATGRTPAQWWDGFASDFEDMGVPVPASGATIAAGNAVGQIVGRYRAFVRYLDAQGRVSNLSPVSNEVVIEDAEKSVEDATWADPVVITSTSHGLSNGDTVLIEGVRGNYGANGVYTIANVTTHTFELVNSSGAGVYTGGGTIRVGVDGIVYSSIPVPSDSRVTRKQLLRNKNGNQNVFYIDLDTDVDSGFGLSDTTFESDKLDTALGDAVPLLNGNGMDLNLLRHGEPPAWKSVIAHHYGRLWAAIDAPYDHGAISVTNGSATVTGIATEWTDEMVNWKLFVRGGNKVYDIDAVNTSTQTITLSENYGGTTDPFAEYELRRSQEDRLTIYYSEPGLPHSWNVLEAGITLSEDPLAGEMTGIMPFRNFLYLLFESRMYRFSFSVDPGLDGQPFFDHWRGCVNNRCWVIVEGASYLLDRQGIHMFGGNVLNQELSLPIQSFFDNKAGGSMYIDWEASDYFHAAHDPQAEVIRWFVTMGAGQRYPRHAIAYQYRHKRFWIEEYPVPITSSCLGRLGSRQQMYAGSTAKRIFAIGTGNLDGVKAQDGTLRGSVTSATLYGLESTDSIFNSKFAGYVVEIVSGTGHGQKRVIASVDDDELTIVEPWHIIPDTTSVFQIGGISWSWKSGAYEFGVNDEEIKRGFHMEFTPCNNSSLLTVQYLTDSPEDGFEFHTMSINTSQDGITTEVGSSIVAVDSNKLNGRVQHYFDGGGDIRGETDTFLQIVVSGVTNNERQGLRRLRMLGVMPPEGGERR